MKMKVGVRRWLLALSAGVNAHFLGRQTYSQELVFMEGGALTY